MIGNWWYDFDIRWSKSLNFLPDPDKLDDKGLERRYSFENEAPKTRNRYRLKNYNFKSCMTQAEPGGGMQQMRPHL